MRQRSSTLVQQQQQAATASVTVLTAEDGKVEIEMRGEVYRIASIFEAFLGVARGRTLSMCGMLSPSTSPHPAAPCRGQPSLLVQVIRQPLESLSFRFSDCFERCPSALQPAVTECTGYRLQGVGAKAERSVVTCTDSHRPDDC